MSEEMLKISHISKQYKLGQIGGTTLREEIQRWNAKRRHEEDPTRKIGARDYVDGETFMALDDVSVEVKKGERLRLDWLLAAYRCYQGEAPFFTSFFENLVGTDQVRKAIVAGLSEEEIRSSWQADLERFKQIRKKYLLY